MSALADLYTIPPEYVEFRDTIRLDCAGAGCASGG